MRSFYLFLRIGHKKQEGLFYAQEKKKAAHTKTNT